MTFEQRPEADEEASLEDFCGKHALATESSKCKRLPCASEESGGQCTQAGGGEEANERDEVREVTGI